MCRHAALNPCSWLCSDFSKSLPKGRIYKDVHSGIQTYQNLLKGASYHSVAFLLSLSASLISQHPDRQELRILLGLEVYKINS